MSTLTVYFRETPCGQLGEGPGGSLDFRYLESWIEEAGFPISVQLPLGPEAFGHERVAPFVASFLPEGESLRRRLEKLIHVDAGHDFGLLSAIGRESAGALSFWPEEAEPFAQAPKYDSLAEEEFDRWGEYAHQLPLHFPGRDLRMSLAGAQSKTALFFNEADQPYLPQHGAPTTHILKPRIPGSRPNTVFVERLTMQIAQSVLGEDRVPATDLWRNCYRVRRFDRQRAGGRIERLHQEDFCLALGRMPDQKYESASPRETLFPACFELLDSLGARGLVRSPAFERLRLLDQVILNVLLHNPDAHLKNYAFIYRDDGALEVSPLYDCLCTYDLRFEADDSAGWDRSISPAAHTRALSMRVGSAENIDAVSRTDWEAFALECGFTKAFVRRRVQLLAEQVRDQARQAVNAVLEEHPAAQEAAESVLAGVSRQLDAALSN